MSGIIHVAVGVLLNERDEVLIALRHQRQHQGGLWEFPGGKLEAGENVQSALKRELKEEVALDIGRCRPMLEVRHDYGDRQVLLDVWRVDEFSGEARGREGQQIAWVGLRQLTQYAFPAANQPIIDALLRSSGQEVAPGFRQGPSDGS
ncbi:MAG: 8-oxo-dGTP diphosphatase MutT [Pseudomonadales bacterium]|nr:8-oxo-dGTP diphosphatase MutT [Pseudomonadales bacterium]